MCGNPETLEAVHHHFHLCTDAPKEDGACQYQPIGALHRVEKRLKIILYDAPTVRPRSRALPAGSEP